MGTRLDQSNDHWQGASALDKKMRGAGAQIKTATECDSVLFMGHKESYVGSMPILEVQFQIPHFSSELI